MNILFCDNPFDGKTVDPDFQGEYTAAQTAEFNTHLFSFETLTGDRDAAAAIRKVKPADIMQPMIYRGWMLKPSQYSMLYNALLAKNFTLINTPAQYQHCHYLPDSYVSIEGRTPRSSWLPISDGGIDFNQVFSILTSFGTSPLVIKDYVKSQKHYWDTACFIPSAADKAQAKSVIETFLSLQGNDLNEGLVIREYVELNDLALHSVSGMPLKEEYRLFFLNNRLFAFYNYWDAVEYPAADMPPFDDFIACAKEIPSNFFSMDIAKTKTGEWTIIELGDGQVAGIPETVQPDLFYNALAYRIRAAAS
ncbi:ATP-grasp domain-containing protein [Chitinophaga sp. CC14]|uniref:ATP-grasp domain-containing protein n=1 Tax=Chitinophaga sp. CC14 TaxID=3029199 RepID=UPI003B7E857A